jgi:tungstate transport system ATP-binding protein
MYATNNLKSGSCGASGTGVAHTLLPGETNDLSYLIRGKTLINRVNLRLDRGAITVIMGPNGAGKSVLLRLLHGLLLPTAGTVRWCGQPLSRAARTRQAMVFQRPVLLRRSVAANIRFVLRLHHVNDRQRTEELLAEAGLSAKAKQPARSLSGGEQQRLSLARALAVAPEVLFLDEPTANLDPAATAAIEGIVRHAHLHGTKIVFVTHDIGQARRIADDVVFLEQGNLVEHTSAELFFDRPATQAARNYLAGRLVLR